MCNLNHLKFISKICTVCIIGFYTFSGFQGYAICKFLNYRTFSMDFTSFSTFEFYLNRFKRGQAMWLNPIGGYRFGRISNFSRRILWSLDGSDHPVPLQLSDLIWSLRSQSNGCGRKWEGSPGRVSTTRLRRRCCQWRGRFRGPGREGSGVRGAELHGEEECVVGVLDCFLEEL
jgi:hypothetical protein